MNDSSAKRFTSFICLGLALLVFAAYSPLRSASFVIFDDNDYILANDMVKQGLSWPGLVWAFSTSHAGNWHPLTWLSHMVDCQLYQLNPAGHHLTNVLLHIANSILLFLLLQHLTRARWSSAMAAALFALHPLHVESVAWISERKDVLSALFWMLTLWAYVRYAEEQPAKIRRSKFFYVGSVILFGLGLMAKPMLVSLPFVLLLLDYWPLQRFPPFRSRLLMEKIPYFILSAASCVITWVAQQRGGAVTTLASLPWKARLENVPIAYVRYLKKTVWPDDLAVLYPMVRHWPAWEVVGAIALLAGITMWVICRGRTHRYLAVGWLWFIGMLLPVIGVVHIGSISMADRYDYLPGIGLFIMIIWTVRQYISRLHANVAAVGAGLALAACLAATRIQAQYWQNSKMLFNHALAVTQENGLIESNLGLLLFRECRLDESLPHLLRAAQFAPDYFEPHYNLGNALLRKGDVAGALAQLEIQAALKPDDPSVEFNFGNVLLDNALPEMAIPHFEKARQNWPDVPDVYYKLGNAFRQAGRPAEAIRQYEKCLQLAPHHVQAAGGLAWMLATTPDPVLRDGTRAVQLALLADQLSSKKDPKIIGILAAAYAETGDFSQAVLTVQRALQLAGSTGQAALADLLRAQLALYRAHSPFRETISLRKP